MHFKLTDHIIEIISQEQFLFSISITITKEGQLFMPSHTREKVGRTFVSSSSSSLASTLALSVTLAFDRRLNFFPTFPFIRKTEFSRELRVQEPRVREPRVREPRQREPCLRYFEWKDNLEKGHVVFINMLERICFIYLNDIVNSQFSCVVTLF